MEEKMPVNEYEEKLMHPKTVEKFFSQMGVQGTKLKEYMKMEKPHRKSILQLIFEKEKVKPNGQINKFLAEFKRPELGNLRKNGTEREEAIGQLKRIDDESLKIIEASRKIAGRHGDAGKSATEWTNYCETIRRNSSGLRRNAKGMLEMIKRNIG